MGEDSGRFKTILSGLTRQECVSVDIEESGLLFASSFPERVVWLADLNIYESRIHQHCAPAFARKAASDSSRPEIDIADRTLRHRFAIGNVAKLQSSARTQNPS